MGQAFRLFLALIVCGVVVGMEYYTYQVGMQRGEAATLKTFTQLGLGKYELDNGTGNIYWYFDIGSVRIPWPLVKENAIELRRQMDSRVDELRKQESEIDDNDLKFEKMRYMRKLIKEHKQKVIDCKLPTISADEAYPIKYYMEYGCWDWSFTEGELLLWRMVESREGVTT